MYVCFQYKFIYVPVGVQYSKHVFAEAHNLCTVGWFWISWTLYVAKHNIC